LRQAEPQRTRLLLSLAAADQYTKKEPYGWTLMAVAEFPRSRQEAGAIREYDGNNPAGSNAYSTSENSIFRETEDPLPDQLSSSTSQ
jgi:hypothetical protein